MYADSNTSLPTLLLVDDDPEFLAYFLSLAEPYNLAFDTCNTLQLASQKILSSSYDAYIIDLNLPDGSGLDLIKEIRKDEKKQHRIAVISGLFCDEQTFKLLKDKYSVNYILDKPIYPQQLDQLLINLCRQNHSENGFKAPDSLENLKKEYLITVSDKLVLLTELVKTAQKTPNADSLNALKNAVHKIAGSAGSYGFQNVSNLCKELELQLNQQLSFNANIGKEWINSLIPFLRKIKYSFQFPNAKNHDQQLDLPTSMSRPSLYVIDGDIKFLELLQREKEEFPIDLLVESNPEKARTLLKSPAFNPRIIVSSETFVGSTINAFDLIKVVRDKPGTVSTIFSVMLEKEDIDFRIDAVQKGVKYLFHKPVSAHLLLKAMIEALEIQSLRNFKVLILDDDPDTCTFMSSALSEVGIEARSIDTPLSLYKTLEEFSPDLLFLDIILPKYDGFNLLKTLKADAVYKNLLIVIVTALNESDAKFNSYSGDADEIFYKPLNKKVLQQRVLTLAKRSATLGLSTAQNRIGLNTLKTLLKRLHEILTASSPFSSHLVLFRLDQYSDLVLHLGQSVVNEFMISISNSLQRIEDETISCYFFDTSTFAILFKDYNESVIENKIFTLLNSIQLQSELDTCFSCSLVLASNGFKNTHEIIRVAENALEEAANKEPAPIKIVTRSLQDLPSHKKTIVLIEPNEDLLLILKTAFDSQDLTVKIFREGKPALEELLNYNKAQLPALIIAERKLPDMDGIEILKTLSARFKSPIPFYFLTNFTAEKDISEGLKYGASEYIIKPFNLSLLVQKSKKAIFERKR